MIEQNIFEKLEKSVSWKQKPIFSYEEKGSFSKQIADLFGWRQHLPLYGCLEEDWFTKIEQENLAYQEQKDWLPGQLNHTKEEPVKKKQPQEELLSQKTEKIQYTKEQKLQRESNFATIAKLKKNGSEKLLLKTCYIVDRSTKAKKELFQVKTLLQKDMTIKKSNKKPQILIYHTHSQENFIDSRKGKQEDTVVGVGNYLTALLEQRYGYQVVHDKSQYDLVNGVLDRSKAYTYSLEGTKQWLKRYPSIQVLIDLHRDGVSGNKDTAVKINGKKMAQIMFFNGLSRDRHGPISYLKNKNLKGNLAFSLQLELQALQRYPELTKKIYLKSYRYNLNLRQRSLLIELGNQNNTLQEAKNAMEPLADLLNRVLEKRE